MASQDVSAKPTSVAEDRQKMKVEMLEMVLEFITNKYRVGETDQACRTVSLIELHNEWQIRHPNVSFNSKEGGSFKQFLVDELKLENVRKKRNQFKCVPSNVKAQLEDIKSKSEIFPSSNDAQCFDSAGSSLSDVPVKLVEGIKGNGVATEVRKRTEQKPLAKRMSETEQYYHQLVRVFFKCGLPALRHLFAKQHNGWSNCKSDIDKFNIGTRKKMSNGEIIIFIGEEPLKSYDQVRKFESGDIMSWDFTLLCKVLLHSESSAKNLNDGSKEAVKTIRQIRNKILAHTDSGELTKHEYENKMSKLCNAIVNGIGYMTEEEFEQIKEDVDLSKDDEMKLYIESFLSEVAHVKAMLDHIRSGKITQKEVYHRAESMFPDWYEWEDLRKKLDMLDTDKNQYILIVDELSSQVIEHHSILASVNWKLVIDFDPHSDNGGLLTQFKSVGTIVSTLVPSQLHGVNSENLPQPNATQWLHANGRKIRLSDDQKANASEISEHNKDEPKDTIKKWEENFNKPCRRAIRSICDKFDDRKPAFCLILGIRNGLPSEITTLLSKGIRDDLEYNYCEISFVSIDSEVDLSNLPKPTCSGMPTFLFLLGLAGLTGKNQETKYNLPSGKKGISIPLESKQYISLSEYMEILYTGCQDIPEGLVEADFQLFCKNHLKNFILGNTITFQSLHLNHDARRDLRENIYQKIISAYEKAQKACIIELKHTPGSGGTTLARRVLWDLHERFPCVIIKMEHALQNFGQDSYGETYIEDLCKRIVQLQSICKIAIVVLMDGDSTQVSTLSSCVVRKLRTTPLVILRCVKNNPSGAVKNSSKESSDGVVRAVFQLDYNLDRTSSEYSDLQKTFDSYCSQFPEETQLTDGPRLRVFHFPMLALLGEFTKLESIVSNSLCNLKEHKKIEYDIAIVVAFLQKYGNVMTPAALISKFILKSNITNEKLANQFDENLMNLMTPGKPQGGKKFTASTYFRRSEDDRVVQTFGLMKYYTFQHHQVAEKVLKYHEETFNESCDKITRSFLDYKVLERYRRNKEIIYVVDQLFLYHEKEQNQGNFSKLVSALAALSKSKMGRNAERIADFNTEEASAEDIQFHVDTILVDAARQSKDATFYSHVARFFSYNQNIDRAIELIEEGLREETNIPTDRKRRVLDTYGHILLNEMKDQEFQDENHLTKDAEKALNRFRQAKEILPRNFPHPLIGIVKVWIFCFDHLMKKFSIDLNMIINRNFEDGFFFNSITECIELLDEVDDMVMELQQLRDPKHTQKLADDQRYRLMEILGKTESKTVRKGQEEANMSQICEFIAAYNKTAPEKYLIQLQAMWLICEVKGDIVRLSEKQRKQLYAWLYKLVIDHKMLRHTRNLLNVAAIQETPLIDIDSALQLIEKWQSKHKNNYLCYFYKYMLYFILISMGRVGNEIRCNSAIDGCKAWTKDNMRKDQKQFFISKDRKEICKLLSRSQLQSLYAKKCNGSGDTKNKDDKLDRAFWISHARDFLLACRGRIQLFEGKDPKPYIKLEPGNIRISVRPNDVGVLGIDYHKDTNVSFIVAFSLAGPKAEAVIIEG